MSSETNMKCDLFILVLASVVQQWRACNAAPLGQSGAPRVKHVVHIGIDGLKPDCLFRDTDGAPNILKRLGNKGTWTLTRSRTTIETVSAPGWSASLCGMSPVSTGIHDNEWLPPWKGNKQGITPVTGNASPIPCVFETIKKQEPSAKTAMFYDWDWMRHLGNEAIPGSLDIDRECRWGTERCDVMIAAQASRYLKDVLQSEAKSYTFVYFGNLDEVGHAKKWCSPEFQEEIKITDGLVGRVLDAIDDVNMTSEVLVYLHSDHGGEEGTTQHGTQTDASLLIPFFMRGPGIKKNETFQTEVYIEDIPCTGVHALGLKPSPWWTGRSLL